MPTEIAYVDETWNPEVGCTKCSPGCLNCYAEKLHNMRHQAYLAGKKLPKQYANPFSEIQLFTERLEIPLHWRKPRRILCCSMGDLFHKSVPFVFVEKVWDTMLNCMNIENNPVVLYAKKHTFLILTKRPERLLEFERWMLKKHRLIDYPNVHLGVTICTQKEADEKIPILLQIPAAHRWLSIEPMLEEINLRFPSIKCGNCGFNGDACYECETEYYKARPLGIDWVVVGCESGSNRRPCKLEWIRNIVQQGKATGVRVFVKQIEINGKVEHDIERFPEDLRVRET